jgi:hypothetical protein
MSLIEDTSGTLAKEWIVEATSCEKASWRGMVRCMTNVDRRKSLTRAWCKKGVWYLLDPARSNEHKNIMWAPTGTLRKNVSLVQKSRRTSIERSFLRSVPGNDGARSLGIREISHLWKKKRNFPIIWIQFENYFSDKFEGFRQKIRRTSKKGSKNFEGILEKLRRNIGKSFEELRRNLRTFWTLLSNLRTKFKRTYEGSLEDLDKSFEGIFEELGHVLRSTWPRSSKFLEENFEIHRKKFRIFIRTIRTKFFFSKMRNFPDPPTLKVDLF